MDRRTTKTTFAPSYWNTGINGNGNRLHQRRYACHWRTKRTFYRGGLAGKWAEIAGGHSGINWHGLPDYFQSFLWLTRI